MSSADEPRESFPEWLAQQTSNLDPDRAAAAKYVVDRWPVAYVNADKILRSLIAEESEFVIGFRLLIEEYVDFYDIDSSKQLDVLRMVAPGVEILRERCSECKREAVPGTGKCSRHGIGLMSEQERTDLVNRISERLLLASDRALRVMFDLMDNAKSEKVRGDMALALMDRIGAGPTSKVELDITGRAEDAAEQVRARLIRLHAVEEARDEDADVVPGETVKSEDESA